MTLIAGFKCSNGVLLSADSQETLGVPSPEGFQAYRCKVDKLQPRIDGYYQWVAGGAGDGNLIDGFTERLRDEILAWPKSLNELQIKDRLRLILLDYRRNEVAASGIADDPLDFLICVMGENDPSLFRADKTVRVVEDWALIGWEEGIYRHDIQQHYKPGQSMSFAMLMGTHVLRLAKSTSNNIGGPTKIVICNDAGLRAMNESDVAELEKRVGDFDSALDALKLRLCDTAVPLDEFTKDLSTFQDAVVSLRTSLTYDIILARLRRLPIGSTPEDVLLLNDPYLSLPSPEECLRALRTAWASVVRNRKTKRALAIIFADLAHANYMFVKIVKTMYDTGAITVDQRTAFATRVHEIISVCNVLMDEKRELVTEEPMPEAEVDRLYVYLTEKIVTPMLDMVTDFCALFETDESYQFVCSIQVSFLSIFTASLVAPFSPEPEPKQLESKSESGNVT